MDHQLADFIGHILGATLIIVWGGFKLLDRFLPRRTVLPTTTGSCPVYADPEMRAFVARLTTVQEKLEAKQDQGLADHRVMDARLMDIKDELRRHG